MPTEINSKTTSDNQVRDAPDEIETAQIGAGAAQTPAESPPPPDGGKQAWIQVSAAFCLTWNSLGLLNSFGTYQTYYEDVLLRQHSASAIAWIGSVQVFLLMTGGFVLGPLADLGYTRSMLAGGTALVVFGFMMTSLGTAYYHIMLAQGLCIGLGSGCLYMPAVTLVPGYFSSRRALAMGVAAVGSSLGAAVYPLVFEHLQPKIGFGWTVRAIGLVVLVLCSYATAVARPRLRYWDRRGGSESESKGKSKSKSKSENGHGRQSIAAALRHLARDAQLRDARYVLQCVAIAFSNLAFFQPLYYLPRYARAHGTPAGLAGNLLVVLNLVAIPGRILPSLVADRIGAVPTFAGICCATAAVDFYWISATNRQGCTAFAVLYGFFSSSVVTLAPVVLSSITDDLRTIGTRLGCVAVLKGVASLIGPPIAGALLDRSHGYLGVQLFTAGAMTLTSVFTLVLLWAVKRR